MRIKYNYIIGMLLMWMPFVSSCRDEEVIVTSTGTKVTAPADSDPIKGFFLLNEGNMGSNKCTLDHFDYSTGIYTRNIFAERNPGVVKELGDVGNDLQIYGNRLYAVVNCSHFVEVMNVKTAQHIGQISIPNCRYITFKGRYAYVSSYAGPVQVDPNARLGYVAKVDTVTLQVVAECTVGYQPEELAIVGDKLYVANSGGYRVPDYDRTVSVIDLNTFTEIKKIDVAVNLHRLEADAQGNLWVSSRGDYYTVPSRTYLIDTATDKVIEELDLSNSDMTRCGDRLYVYSQEWNYTAGKNEVSYAVIDIPGRQIVTRNFIKDGTEREIAKPYGMAVNPVTGELFVTDAKDYVTPGVLYCFDAQGYLKWSVTTGDAPAHIAFSEQYLWPIGENPDDGGTDPEEVPAYITRVLDYRPAPGQFVNEMPKYEEGDTQADMNVKVLEAIGHNKRGMISLGGFGGYVVVGFDHTIPNVKGLRDFRVLGNPIIDAFTDGSPEGNSCEPGIIQVAYDANKNGQPDADEWYEIAGSAHRDATAELWYQLALDAGNDVRTVRDYRITYHRPATEQGKPTEEYIYWEDNQGGSGYRRKNTSHLQPYYPAWVTDNEMTFSGTRLPQNGVDTSGNGSYFKCYKFAYGYADNELSSKDDSAIDISWAVDAEGKPVDLPGADFIKVYSGVNQENGWIGENSTEISSVEDLHKLGVKIDTRP